MKFDTVIIGGGLAAVTCGIVLAERGRRCAIFSSGESALMFSSGSLDLLNRLPSGEEVKSPQEGVERLMKSAKEHPYAKLGGEKFALHSAAAFEILKKSGIEMERSVEGENHMTLSAMGQLMPTWLSLEGIPIFPYSKKIEWKRVALINFKGFSDFQHRFVADGVRKAGVEIDYVELSLAEMERLRENRSEMRASTIAQMLEESSGGFEELVESLRMAVASKYDAILLPAVFRDQSVSIDRLRKALAFENIFIVPTMPPSATGMEIQRKLLKRFELLGGVFFTGHRAVSGEVKDGRVVGLGVDNHIDRAIVADDYVLATGSFFSRGLNSTPDGISEPIFGADVVQGQSRDEWCKKDLFSTQEFMGYGVKTTPSFNVLMGKPIENLYAAGSILGNYDPIYEGSGGGVAMVTAIEVANQILSKR